MSRTERETTADHPQFSDKRESTARVIRQRQLSDGIHELVLETSLGASAKPGQFVNLYCRDSARLLPRPISICEAGDRELTLVYRVVGNGTREFAALQPGDCLRLAGNLGNGYRLSAAAGKHVVIAGGGLGIPPMLFLARSLHACAGEDAPASLTVVLGYRDADTVFLDRAFDEYSKVFIASDDGSVGMKGTALDVIRTQGLQAETTYVCGPMPMLRAFAQDSEERRRNGKNNACYVSLEERMACGIGACLGCVVKTTDTDSHSQVRNARICAEGPVFDSREIAWGEMK
ncbi:MAG: dihydroorotate dehydrogenase electron transfer subunit [Lachnospiraceae bacterium]|nr:dihydroorotate dehydrogenase electron transfer subunit [Lachnospiraceae bacterium]